MKILITGGAGFIGSELGKYLISRNHEVHILDNLEYGYRDNFEDNKILNINFIKDDIRSKEFRQYLIDIDVVFHLAGISALPECEVNPYKAFDVNTTAVANILNACRESNVQKVIFASTSAVYENNDTTHSFKETDIVQPNLIYATTKYSAEQICKAYAQNYGMNIIICRFFNVFGPHQDFKRKSPPLTSYLIREILNDKKPILYNSSDAKRDYIYIEDLMQYLYLIMQSSKTYSAEIFNLATGLGYSAKDIAQIIYSLFEKKVEYVGGDPIRFWNQYEDLFNKNFNLSKERVKKEVYKHCIGDNSKIIKELNYTPKYNLTEGLKNIINYQRNFHDQK